MRVKRSRPSWWQLWLLVPALAIAAFLEARASLSPAGHIVVEVAIVLIVYGLLSVWMRANRIELLRESSDDWSQANLETVAQLPTVPGAIAGSNGDGRREPAWYVPAPEPDADLLTAREQVDG